MTSDVYCPNCGRKLLVDWGLEEVNMISGDEAADGTEHILYGDELYPDVVWRVSYKRESLCPFCGTELEISHNLEPHFVADIAR